LRETVRQLRSEKNAAEASAARARLLLDARDDNQAVAAAKADFEADRERMMAKIAELEAELRTAPRPGPHLVSVDGEELDLPGRAAAQSPDSDAVPTDLDGLRASIDAMTASLTASAAIELDGRDRINALLDEAEQEGADSNLVTSLVEARDRLRSRKKAPSRRKSAKSSGKTTTASMSAKAGSESTGASDKGAKISAATASGTPAGKTSAMPRASENDLKVI
jgi:hypothetical protein